MGLRAGITLRGIRTFAYEIDMFTFTIALVLFLANYLVISMRILISIMAASGGVCAKKSGAFVFFFYIYGMKYSWFYLLILFRAGSRGNFILKQTLKDLQNEPIL